MPQRGQEIRKLRRDPVAQWQRSNGSKQLFENNEQKKQFEILKKLNMYKQDDDAIVIAEAARDRRRSAVAGRTSASQFWHQRQLVEGEDVCGTDAAVEPRPRRDPDVGRIGVAVAKVQEGRSFVD